MWQDPTLPRYKNSKVQFSQVDTHLKHSTSMDQVVNEDDYDKDQDTAASDEDVSEADSTNVNDDIQETITEEQEEPDVIMHEVQDDEEDSDAEELYTTEFNLRYNR